MDCAMMLFEEMPKKTTMSWNAMIASHAKSKEEVVEAFTRMKATKVSPNGVTMATVISAYAHLGALKLKRELHLEMNQNGFDLDVYIGSTLHSVSAGF
ncbi:putative pentatricopeptide repeat-containing protein [Acorus calamus]|uniref:Pentatricopeptide repeat-containing protein n=1 Tax=Acorus calamus TaxID=4465 RepID=A0AAV9DBX1_ACOCL|nr:putative pentatricopeptide repeat-containing protein [Acorus calamus]